jgi:hypothetical protein
MNRIKKLWTAFLLFLGIIEVEHDEWPIWVMGYRFDRDEDLDSCDEIGWTCFEMRPKVHLTWCEQEGLYIAWIDGQHRYSAEQSAELAVEKVLW